MKALLSIPLFLISWLVLLPVFAADNHHEKSNHAEHDHVHYPEETTAKSHEDNDHDDEHGHSEELSTRIDDSIASQTGIATASISSQVLRQNIVAYGSLTTGPEQLSHVRARYSGLIKSVKATIGDKVKNGDLLATVESNESLRNYQIVAPINGIIIQRHANTGEVTQDQILFSIANFDTLWAEFRIYPNQQSMVKAGQTVNINIEEREYSAPIQHVIPALDKPYKLARVKLESRSDWLSPGLLVEGRIVIGELKVDLAVERKAIQTMGGQQGVFVRNGNEYAFTPIQSGHIDNHYVEVLSGLSRGQEYVSENSYLIKADIEKSEAEHVH